MGGQGQPTGPDFTLGFALSELPDGGMVTGQAAGEAVLLARRGDEVFAVGATCTHYGGPLGEGLLEGTQVRCPWHHACFDLRTGEAVGPPALNPLPCWNVERRGDRVFVLGKREVAPRAARKGGPQSIVIVGAGAAGNAAAEMLRRQGYGGRITMIGPEHPVDRPNLSKDYLAGTAPEEWIPLRGPDFYEQQKIELVNGKVTRIAGKQVGLADGRTFPFDRLLIATGADPIRLDVPGAEHAHLLRTLADSRAIIAAAQSAKRAVVIGASFIGLEVAASLRARNLEVHVVAPEARPLERILGPELGDFVRALHEERGVVFHLGRKPKSFAKDSVTLDDGAVLPADLIVAGVGVRPQTQLGELAGCRIDRGILVDETLATSVADISAAGDCARYPDRHGRSVRIEHWAVAERLGQTAARNLLGEKVPFRAVPFFWSQHYDVPINYVGHAERWDRIDVRGNMAERNCVVAYREGGRIAAVASIYRDRESLLCEVALERDDQPALEAILDTVR